MKKTFVTIAGNIGIGKSTLTTRLAERFGWAPYYEVVDTNPYLADFYKDMRRWSFHLQVFFLSKRFQHHREIWKAIRSVVQDRSIYEDAEIFAKGLWLQGKFDERDYKNYVELFECMNSYLKPPTLMVGLVASVKSLKKRIAKRGRECEKDIADDYLQQLNQHYDAWYKNYNRGPFICLNTENLDLAACDEDFEHVADQITTALSHQIQKQPPYPELKSHLVS